MMRIESKRKRAGASAFVALAMAVSLMLLAGAAGAAKDETILVNRASGADGAAGQNGPSFDPAVSAEGRFVAFQSGANNLVENDVNLRQDIFVRDTVENETILASRRSGADGAQSNGNSFTPSISADGRFVAFVTEANNLSPVDDNGRRDVYVRDLRENTTTLVSRQSHADGGRVGDDSSARPVISADGRFVAFESSSDNFSVADDNGVINVFVRDLRLNTTTLVSRRGTEDGIGGVGANGSSRWPSISADGSLIAFHSDGDNLSEEDDDNATNVFVRDTRSEETILVSRASGADGAGADDTSERPSISADGNHVAFASEAGNLSDADDGNFINVFVRDLENNETSLISRQSASDGGAGANGNSGANFRGDDGPSISGDGRHVAFTSDAPNLSADNDDNFPNTYVRDTVENETILASRRSASDGGAGADGESFRPEISADGRFVAFDSDADNLSDEDDDGSTNIFLRDVLGPLPDATPPETTITAGPAGFTNENRPTFEFESSEENSTFECRIGGGNFEPCDSPFTAEALPDGSHTFEVRATDAAGNTDETPDSRTFTVDTTNPSITNVAPRNGSVISLRRPLIRATVKDNVSVPKSNIRLFVDGRRVPSAGFAYNAATGRLSHRPPRLSPGRHVVRIVAVDRAGNVGRQAWAFRVR